MSASISVEQATAVWSVVEDVTGDVWISRVDDRSVAESARRRMQAVTRRSFSVVKVAL
jgi:hypothetical protein